MANIYNSKYFTSEQIDERLLEGYYQDVRGFGFTGNKAQYQALMASIKTLDLSQIYANNPEVLNSFTSLSEVLNVLLNAFHWGNYFPKGFVLEYTYNNIRYRYEIVDTSNPSNPNSWRSAGSSLDSELAIDASILVGTNPDVYVARQGNNVIKGLTGLQYGSLRKIYDDLNNSTTPQYDLDNNILEVYSAGLVTSLRASLRYNQRLTKLHNSMYWRGSVGDARDAFAHCISLTECLLTDLNVKEDTGVSFIKQNGSCLIGGMFYNCRSISKIYLPNLSEVTSTVYRSGNKDIHTFSLCYNLTDLRFRGLNCDINFYDNPLTISSITYILNNASNQGNGKKIVLRKDYVNGYANTKDGGLFGEAVNLVKSNGWSVEVYDGLVYQSIQSIFYSSTTGKYTINYTNGSPIEVVDELTVDPQELIFSSDSVILLLVNHSIDRVTVSDSTTIKYTLINGGLKVYLQQYVEGYRGSITIEAGGFTKTIPVSVEGYVETTTTTSTTTEEPTSTEEPTPDIFTVSPSSIEVIQGRAPVVITANKPILRVEVQGYGVVAQKIDDYNYGITNNGLESSIYIDVYSTTNEMVRVYTIAHTTTTTSTTTSSSTSSSTEPPSPDPLEVYPDSLSIELGNTINLYSNYEDAQYSSRDLNVVTVDEYGVVTAVGVGNTQITVSSVIAGEVVSVPVDVVYNTTSSTESTEEPSSSTESTSSTEEPESSTSSSTESTSSEGPSDNE